MGDGSKREGGYILCTDNFTLAEVEILREVLGTNFDINHTSINFKDGLPRLRILASSRERFKVLISPYV